MRERTFMKLPALTLLAGAVFLAGCSSQAGSGGSASPTATPRTASQATNTHSATASATRVPTATKPAHVHVAAGGPMQQGQSYMKQGDYADAQSSFIRATKQNPKSLVAYERLGMASLYNRDYKAAFAAFRKAAAMHPRNTAMLYYAAGAGLYAGDYASARKYVDRLLVIKPNYAAAYHVRLLIDANLLDRKAQLKDARAVARLQPKDPNAYNDLGLALANNTQPKAAYAAFTRAIKMQPNNWQYYKNRALTDGLLKNIAAEIKDAKRSLALATDPVVKKQLRDMLSHAQKAARAQH